MARPPAQVRFPGDKNRKQRVKVRGIKQASKEIQKRLERNLEKLLEDPEVIQDPPIASLGSSPTSSEFPWTPALCRGP